LAKYVIDNVSLKTVGLGYFCFCKGINNILLGFMHGYSNKNEATTLVMIVLTETTILGISIFLLRKRSVFIIKFNIWMSQLPAFIRILMIFCFILD
jgi:hypothetical protein